MKHENALDLFEIRIGDCFRGGMVFGGGPVSGKSQGSRCRIATAPFFMGLFQESGGVVWSIAGGKDKLLFT